MISAVRLGVMLLDHEEKQAQADQQSARAARANRKQALEREIESLKDAATATRTGALVSGTMTIAGGTSQVISGATQVNAARAKNEVDSKALKGKADTWNSAGLTLRELSPNANKLLSNEDSHKAEQATARKAAEEAEWRSSDAKNHEAKLDRMADRILDLTQQTLQTVQSSKQAVLSNFRA